MKSMQKIHLFLFLLPVAFAHYYAVAQNPLTTVSSLASACLLVLTLGAILSRIQQGLIRTAAGLFLYSLLAIYLAAQFLSYYLQGSYFNQQFYFHFNLVTLVEAWSVYRLLFFLFLGWIACVWLTFYYFRNQSQRSGHSAATLTAVLVAALFLDPGLRQAAINGINSVLTPKINSLDTIAWEQLDLEAGALTQSNSRAIAGKNLVLIFLEGFDKLYLEDEVFPGLASRLNDLNAEGWQLENLNQVHGSSWTMGGLVSTLCGTPLLYESDFGGNEVMFTRMLDKASCLPDVLDSASYHQVFMGGASLDFAGKGEFLGRHSFDEVLGKHELVPELENPEYLNSWGIFDDSLFSLAVQQFERLASLGKPFNLTLLTVDTHHPIGEPSASCSPYEAIDNTILHAVHCTDYLVGNFIDQLKQHPAYEDTLVVLVSDHLAMRNNAYSLFPPDYPRRLYFNVLNSDQRVAEQPLATPMDLAPTLLHLLAVSHDVDFLAGIDLLDSNQEAAERDVSNPDRLAAIRYINSNHLSVLENTLLYSLNRLPENGIDISPDMQNVSFPGNGITFDAVGSDPYFVLPALPGVQYDNAKLYMTIETGGKLGIAVYYEAEEGGGYTEENTWRRPIGPGVNRMAFDLDGAATGSRLRIDTDGLSGRCLIRSLEIRSE